MTKLPVVLGSGPLGRAVVRRLAGTGQPVRVVNRSGGGSGATGVELMSADLTDPADAVRACTGASVVYHCANPPYARWPELHPPLMAAVIEGAAAADARLVFGDNLYAYGPAEGPLTEGLPHTARDPNGRTRALIAGELIQAHDSGRVRASIARGSDFFGPHAHESAVGDRVFSRLLAGKSAQVLGDPDLPHTVTYIDDFARALITVGERDDAQGTVWHVPNAQTITIRRFVEMVAEEADRKPRVQAVPRWGLAMAAVINPTLRAVREQLYQFERPWVVDSSRFEHSFGWTATPLPEAIRATVEWFREHGS